MRSVDVVTVAPVPVMSVALRDLHAQHLSIKAEIDTAITDVIAKSAFVRGPHVDAFEEQFARRADAGKSSSTASAT